jgi:2-dehydro-3-deoxyphosphogluconate aldolase/(4S)-4-hydroxy-2-oxoglutarate aldolase
LDAGAEFLTSDGFDPEIVNFALKENTVVIPGTLSPSEVMRAWKLGPDFVKVVPCAPVGGERYIRSLKAMFPNVPLIAAGGVNQQTASGFILAGAVALGIGSELIPREAIRMRQPDRIAELARRFCSFVSSARRQAPGSTGSA